MLKNNHQGHRKRLRQRFTSDGFQGFHDYEIIELLLSYAIPRKDVKPIAKQMLEHFGSLPAIFESTAQELQLISGVGTESAMFFQLIRQTSQYYLQCSLKDKVVLNQVDKVKKYLRLRLQGNTTEAFGVIYMDNQHRYLDAPILFKGTLDYTTIFPRDIIKKALELDAKAMILFHNHPGGSTEASTSDIQLTKKLQTLSQLMEIKVLDHFLIAETHVLSFLEHGWMTRQD
ncbi:MAG: DNA repair protein RadC [Mariprofundaceae bacterium]|nr:DNA repair protein RadC [Mariprofundaceae bacterium]